MSNLMLELNYKQKKLTCLSTCVFGVLGLIVLLLTRESFIKCVVLAGLIALMLSFPTQVYTFAMTIGRDIIACHRFVKFSCYMAVLEYREWTIARVFHNTCKKYPKKNCFLMDDRVFTFEQLASYSNRVGAYFKTVGLKYGDCVALFMESRPEYPAIWLGLSKLGVVTALINTHQRRDTLLHSMKVAHVRAIIVGTELTGALKDILSDEEVKTMPIYQFSDEEQRNNDNFELIKGAFDLSMELKQKKLDFVNFDYEMNICKPKDKLMYVYTSGTTGLPKAAVITNLRYLFLCAGGHFILSLKSDDIIYNPLPLYHSAGGIVAVGNAILFGSTVALRKKFSASNFWKDCIRYECTAAQYIGELCRYLLSTPHKPEDTQHKLRIMYGNGLRPQIWQQFMTRFNIPQIGEVYGSTEGNSNLANMTNRVGAVGFVPLIGRKIYPVQVIKVDEGTGEPLRDSVGYCTRCKPGETGLLIGKIIPKRVISSFNGYADKESTEKKLLRNVFKEGDMYFNSGDMIVSDILGYFYFKDRTGDTFRWRGENVATSEVEAIITNVIGLQDCVVYGVDIPHVEGKAGMAAIEDPDRKVDLQHLSLGIRGSLPPYAQPLFIRIMDAIPRTATFKMKKRDLVTEAFDINKIRDPIYYWNKDGIYRPLNQDQYQNIINGKAGL